LELRVEVARRQGVFDDADRNSRLSVYSRVRQRQKVENVLQEAIDSKKAVAMRAGGSRDIIPGDPKQGWRAVIGKIPATLGRAGLDGKVGRNRPQHAVGPHQSHRKEALTLLGRKAGGLQTDVARPRRRTANQTGHAAAVANTIARFGFNPQV